jgi:hypothetical protein
VQKFGGDRKGQQRLLGCGHTQWSPRPSRVLTSSRAIFKQKSGITLFLL